MLRHYKMLRHLLAAALVSGCAMTAAADDFDLSSQRGEVQEYGQVAGRRVDHSGPIVNPTPHQVSHPVAGTLDVSRGFRPAVKQHGVDDVLATMPRDTKHGARLSIDYGAKAAAKAGVKAVGGAYRLEVGKKGVDIVGYDESGAYYALQTLRQLLEYNPTSLDYVVINDWPDLPSRGVVEGFYGEPWSHEARLSLIEMYGRNKLNTYIYGPKDDPYHSSPNWRLPYPEDQAAKLRELASAARSARVNFVWAIHPGQDIRWDKADYDSLLNKFNHMYDLGVRGFALFFDDISGIGANPQNQAELVNDLTRDFVNVKGDVAPIMICPTDYSQLWANPNEWGTLAVYGRSLAPNVDIFWTGAAVCSDMTPETLEFVNSRIKRPAMYWWNFPVSDYCANLVLQGPVYGLDTSLTSNEVAGIMSNPMEHAEASKLALYGVADYAWNIGAYNPIDNWERGLEVQMPGAPEAYRTFAIHSCDTENGYRRAESWETDIFEFNDYTPGQFDALRAEFARVAEAPAKMRSEGGNAKLIAELEPWLVQSEKMGRRGLDILDLIKVYEQGNDSTFWNGYVKNLMSATERQEYEAHKSGIMKLQPFYEAAMEGMITECYKRMSGRVPAMYTGVGTYQNLRGPVHRRLMVDGDTTTMYCTNRRQYNGDWVGLDLGTVRPVEYIQVLQGRHEGDTDFFDLAILEASLDGEQWTALTDTLRNSYDLRYAGAPVDARYVRIHRLDETKRDSWVYIKEFYVNPVTAERTGVNPTAEGVTLHDALYAFDDEPRTSVSLNGGTITFDRLGDATELLVLAADNRPASVTIYDAKGKVIGTVRTDAPYGRIVLPAATARIAVSGDATVHQLIQR